MCEPALVFRSTGRPGFSPAVTGDARHVEARKLEHGVTVRFTPVACTIRTPEGMVHARAGDAILSGMAGENWRVSAARFPHKYRPIPPTCMGEPGLYVSLPNLVMAVQIPEAFEVLLADEISRLHGRPGDWLVDYGDGSLGIVAAGVFIKTYVIVSSGSNGSP